MPRFFITASQIGERDSGEKTVLIFGEDAAHITKSLRMKPGEQVTVCDGVGREYSCMVEKTGETVTLAVTGEKQCETEPPYRATVYQALVKGDKFDTVVQKSVECGACRIVPFISERCIVRLDKKEAAKKVLRWQKIAEAAAKQCGRGIIPEVSGLLTFKEAVAEASRADIPLFCYEDESGRTLRPFLEEEGKCETVSLMIGSEGGFSPSEAQLAVSEGMVSVGLGKRILRTETASSFVLSCLSYRFEL
ncbi:MAG: 16S rRNA (uracil(1498)-N(3))-methyltransferase [Clostridia bacterium]|nr:16S rRNA (uracil(1498)-N(3))-methyltransferase [Clostridia bacterium]